MGILRKSEGTDMKKKFKDNWSLSFVGIFLLTVGLYILYRGEDIIVTVHDNLDAWQGQYAAIKSANLIFGEGKVPFLHGAGFLPVDGQ